MPSPMKKLPKGTHILLLLTGIFYLNFVSRIVLSPLLPQIKRDLSLSTGRVSGLFLFLSIGYFSAQIASGFLSSRIGHKWTIFLSAFLSACFLTVLGISYSIPLIILSVVLLGLSTGLYLPSGIATITSIFQKDFWGRAVSVHEIAPNLAFITAPLIASFFIEKSNWHFLMLVLAVLNLFLATLLSRTKMGNLKGTAPWLSSCMVFLKKKGFWVMLILFGLGITSTIGIYNILPIYLVQEHGFSEIEANYLISLSRVATLFTAVIGGFLTDRFGAIRVIGGVLFITGLITVTLGITEGLLLKIAVFSQPVLAVCFFPAAFSAISFISNEKDRNLLVSMIIPFAFVFGAGVMPTIIGWMADYGHFRLGFVIAGAFLSSGFLIALVNKKTFLKIDS